MFTDVVGSTETAARLEDVGWKSCSPPTMNGISRRSSGTEDARCIRPVMGSLSRSTDRRGRCGAHRRPPTSSDHSDSRCELATVSGRSSSSLTMCKESPCTSGREWVLLQDRSVLRLTDREGPRGWLGSPVRGRGRARAEGRPRPTPLSGGELRRFPAIARAHRVMRRTSLRTIPRAEARL
jgi:hypothetical protein